MGLGDLRYAIYDLRDHGATVIRASVLKYVQSSGAFFLCINLSKKPRPEMRGESGGGPPHSKTLRARGAAVIRARVLECVQSSGAFFLCINLSKKPRPEMRGKAAEGRRTPRRCAHAGRRLFAPASWRWSGDEFFSRSGFVLAFSLQPWFRRRAERVLRRSVSSFSVMVWRSARDCFLKRGLRRRASM